MPQGQITVHVDKLRSWSKTLETRVSITAYFLILDSDSERASE
jgi:hypothetical protein